MNQKLSALLTVIRSLQSEFSTLFSEIEKNNLSSSLSQWIQSMMDITTIELDVPATMATMTVLVHLMFRFEENPHLTLKSEKKVSRSGSTSSATAFIQAWNQLLEASGVKQPPSMVTRALQRMVEHSEQLMSELDELDEMDFKSLFLDSDVLGLLVQRTLRPRLRKRLAAHFTNHHITRVLLDRDDLLYRLSCNCDQDFDGCLSVTNNRRSVEFRVLDPFAGSGRLLIAVGTSNSLRLLVKQHSNKKVVVAFHAIELYPLSAMACALNLFFLRDHLIRSLGLHSLLEVNIFVAQGDAFKLFQERSLASRDTSSGLKHYLQPERGTTSRDQASPRVLLGMFDVVVMNPPYTRYRMLEPSYRATLKDLFQEESRLFDYHAGLHVFSLFLGMSVLKKGGLLLAVLPASMLHARYAWALKQHWLKRHGFHLVAAFSTEKAFSDDSEFREVTIVLQKLVTTRVVHFLLLDALNLQVTRQDVVSREQLEGHWNWLTFFLDRQVLQHFKQLSDLSLVVPASRLEGFRLLRGFEMYGPEFFFLPNSHWNVLSETSEGIVIGCNDSGCTQHSKSAGSECPSELMLPESVVRKALRKPSLYGEFITPHVSHWVFMPSANEMNHDGVKDYISWGNTLNLPAKHKFGSSWATHVHDQVIVKRPMGRVFIPDKISLSSHATLVHYLDDEILASKNFYLFARVRDGGTLSNSEDGAKDAEKLLAAWMCSSLFLFLNAVQRREIGGSLGRLQIIDYMNNPLLLEVTTLVCQSHREHSAFLQDWLTSTFEIFDDFRQQRLPPIPQQLDDPTREELDDQFITLLQTVGGVTIQGEEIREQLRALITDLASRDK